MNKVQTKRFAFLAILMSLFLAVTAFAFMSVRTKASAEGETELTMPRTFATDTAAGFGIPVSELANHTQGPTDAATLTKVYVMRGATKYAASHVYTWGKLAIYFNDSGYLNAAVQSGDQFVLEEGFSLTVGTSSYICTKGASWTYDGTAWQADWEEELEDLSAYTDMHVTGMTVESRHGQTPFCIHTDSANTVDVTANGGSDDIAVKYTAFVFPDGTPGTVWYCRKDKEQANMFVRPKDNPGGTIAMAEINQLVGARFTVKRGFRLDEVSALKEDVTFVYKASGWKKLVPATAINVADENNLSLNNGATLQLNVTLTPADSSDDIVYTALDNGVAVSASGLVTGKAVGTSQVKITAGSAEKTVSITVKTPPTIESISVNGTLEIYQYVPIATLSGSDSAIGALEGVYHYSDETTDTFAVTKEMLGGWDAVNTDVAGDYTVKMTKDGKETNVTVTVKASCTLTVAGSGASDATGGGSKNVMWITFAGSQSELNFNDAWNPPSNLTEIVANMVPYVQTDLANGAAGSLTFAMQLNYIPSAGKRTVNLYWQLSGNLVNFTRGDTVTLKKGYPALATATESERIAQDITFVFDGKEWVQLVEPTSLSITNKETKLFINVPHTLQITTDPADATGVLSFESSHPEYATVSDTGVVTPKKLTDGTVAKVTVTVRYKDLFDTIEFTIENEPVKTGIEIEDEIPLYYVPLNSSFSEVGYELYYHFVYDDGKIGSSYSVKAEEIGEDDFDFTQEGDRPLTITVEGFTDTIMVHVYEVKKLVKWQDLGVDGYGDDRNQAGQWAGSMLITARNYSSSAANITGQVVDIGLKELGKMFDYVTYTTADGQNVYTRENGKLGGWLLGSTILINVNGKGFTGAPENGYQLGDKIKFAKGMPLYGWSGELDPTLNPNDVSTPKAGTGCMYVIGVLENDLVYYCYDQNDTYSMWTPYVEYTDFTVRSSISITVEGVGSLGATFTPADATTGYFTYVSSDTSVVTVNESGNLVGVKEGTATITVTAHPIEASGYEKEPSSKTVAVTVKKGIAKVSGNFTVKKGAAFEKGNYKITVEYTDGTSEEIALDDDRVLAEDVDTSVVGESSYIVMVTVDGTSKRGTFTVNVKKGGCGSYLTGGSIALFGSGIVCALAAVIVRKKKQSQDKN